MPDQRPVIYIVSDSVGETAEVVTRAAMSQFDGGLWELRYVTHANEQSIIEDVVRSAAEEHAVIAFTVVLVELRDYLLHLASAAKVEAVDIMGPMVTALERISGRVPRSEPGLVHQLNDEYFRRIEAVEFAVKYDDGRDPRGLVRADVILIGVSRTSKTPLSMYLARKRLRVANVPLVPEIAPAQELFWESNRRKLVGLTIGESELHLIRRERLKSLGLAADVSYASIDRIEEELQYARDIMSRLKCPVIDVSNKAVEETAATILQFIGQSR